jgi:hypothetical protein
MSYEPGSHQPPKWLVRDPSAAEWEMKHDGSSAEVYIECNTPEEVRATAERVMAACPGEFVDIYQHVQARRQPKENSNEA